MDNIIKKLANKEKYEYNDLLDIMEILRMPGGCPWDREQTHASIRNNFLEETYEVAEAIDNDDKTLMCEELGDVMLQVVFHAQMEKENGVFDMTDVIHGVCKKLVRRHPHIFADIEADTSEKVMDNWDRIKKEEKGQKDVGDTLASVPVTLPALMRMQKIIKRAKKAGMALCDDSEKFDGLSKDGYARLLIEICDSAARNKVDLEEVLAQKCSEIVKNVK